MKKGKKITSLALFIIILITGIFWFKPETEWKEGMIIMTAVPAETDLINQDFGIDDRYIEQARILGIDPVAQDEEPVLFTEEFYSARSPEVSYDGKKLLFAGQKSEGDVWQIYIRDLVTFDLVQVTACPVNCTDPAWLPDGRIIYSRINDKYGERDMHTVHVSFADGCCKDQLTYHPESAVSSSVTTDGRIVTLSRQVYPEYGSSRYMTFRTDGTKSELFYGNDAGGYPVSRCWQNERDDIYFIERLNEEPDRNLLVKVAFGHPLSSRKPLSDPETGDFHSLYPYATDQLIVSVRQDVSKPFGLNLFDLSENIIGENLWQSDEYHLIEPVVLKERPLPMKLPEIVDKSKDKGTLLCHDAGQSEIHIDENFEDSQTDKVQVFGIEGLIGEVKTEGDGSFYIQIDADSPVRFQTVNAQGEVLRGPSSWVWVRPGEKRSCVGCHENPELAPANQVPEALYSGMVSLPEGTRTDPVVLMNKMEE